MAIELSEHLATRVRAVLRSGDHPASAKGTTAEWRADRDRWVDELDPRNPGYLDAAGIRDLIDFLAESGPGAHSRMTPEEWSSTIDRLTPELLFTTR